MLDRREFIKAQAVAAAAAAGGISLPAQAQQSMVAGQDAKLKWSKAPCRFCGTGCGVMVATKDNRVVATHGDIKAEVNRGLNCVKGYFLSKIMYGQDRLTTPLLRMRDGKYHKEGEFFPVSWDQAFDEMASQWKRVIKEKGPDCGRHVRLGPVDDLGGLRRHQADARGLPHQQSRPQCPALHGLGRRRLHPHLRHGRADGLLRRFRARRRLRALGLQHGGDAPHPVDPDNRPPPLAPHVKVAVLSTFEHRSFELADIPMVFEPSTDLAILNFIANHIIQTNRVNQEFVDKHCNFRLGQKDIGYGLRPEHVLEVRAANAKDSDRQQAHRLRHLRQVRQRLHAGEDRRT